MVKADVKRDYYADLELPSTVDADDIKKQFRTLAKLYHPDRNPGKEVDVVAKFQAVQAAHEILSDPQQKAKYDADRAKLSGANATAFRRPPPPPPPPANTAFPPPPRRSTTGTTQFTYVPPNTRSKPPPSSGADKFASYARAAQQQRDMAYEENQSRAEAHRAFQYMKPTQPPPQSKQTWPVPPSMPRKQDQYPTAPRAAATGPAPQAPRPQRSYDSFQPEFEPGFPGMAKTQSTKKPTGFASNLSGDGEPPPPRSSAYAAYARGEKTQASNPHVSNPPTSSPQSSYFQTNTAGKQKPVTSPLRHTRSSTEFNEAARPQRPGIDRISTRYATAGGEKTYVTTAGVAQSASVRNSPVDPSWGEEPENLSKSHTHPPFSAKHHSTSPNFRPHVGEEQFSSSSGSSDDETDNFETRPKRQPREPRPKVSSANRGPSYHAFDDNDPALTGQFPSTNYTNLNKNQGPQDECAYPDHKHTNPQEEYTAHYEYPPPPPRSNMKGFEPSSHSNNHTEYPPPPSRSDATSQRLFAESKTARSNGIPRTNGSDGSHATPAGSKESSNFFPPTPKSRTTSSHLPPERPSASSHDINTKFNAANWDGKFVNGGEYFQPDQNGDRKSPSRSSRSRARSIGRGPSANPRKDYDAGSGYASETLSPTSPGRSKNHAFQPAKFSADEWAEKFKDQKWSIPSGELNGGRSRTPRKGSKSTTSRKPAMVPKPVRAESDSSEQTEAAKDSHKGQDRNVDAMDIDDSLSDTVPPTPPTEAELGRGGPTQTPQPRAPPVDLTDLSNVAPIAPSSTGLRDLKDLSTNLPFESGAAKGVDLEGARSTSSSRDLNLPKPPRPVIPPSDANLSQHTWERYIAEMGAYQYEWSVFNKKMIEHFKARQDQVDMSLEGHWMSRVGDGPQNHGDDHGVGKAGYATFMVWLRDDAKCREWWNVANEKYRICFEDLGRVREKVKSATGVAGF